MSVRAILSLAAVLLAGATTAGRAADPIPLTLRSLKPYQVVEQIMALRQVIGLSEAQFVRLDDLSIAIKSEKHRWVHRGVKPHVTRHVPMVTQQQAYVKAMAVLAPDQQARVEALFPAARATPRPVRRPSVRHGKP